MRRPADAGCYRLILELPGGRIAAPIVTCPLEAAPARARALFGNVRIRALIELHAPGGRGCLYPSPRGI